MERVRFTGLPQVLSPVYHHYSHITVPPGQVFWAKHWVNPYIVCLLSEVH